MEGTPLSTPPDSVSIHTYTIAGIVTTVYGLEQAQECKKLTCIWMLHPRLADQSYMGLISRKILSGYYHGKGEQGGNSNKDRDRDVGVIAITFDQRNHGTREVAPLANRTWLDTPPNPTHAQDMFSIYHGTTHDLSLLITYLPTYIPPSLIPNIDSLLIKNYVMGVSLGGHGAWLSVIHEPRISGGIVVIGCADYGKLMAHRMGVYKTQTEKRIQKASSDGNNSAPITIQNTENLFPTSLQNIITQYDPAALLYTLPSAPKFTTNPLTLLSKKKILLLSGGADKLVPYECSTRVITSLSNHKTLKKSGFEINEIVYPGVGHECTEEMVMESTRWVLERVEKDWGKGRDDTGL